MDDFKNELIINKDPVIVIESSIKSHPFLTFLKKTVEDILISHQLQFKLIEIDGFYLIIKLETDSMLVDTMELLGKISGISYIFIAIQEKQDFEFLTKSSVSIGEKLILEDEYFSIMIKSSKIHVEDNTFLHYKSDLEFNIQSELTSLSKKTYLTNSTKVADKILYILIGSKTAYISIFLQKGRDHLPINFLDETVVCPIYNDQSLLSLFKVLNSGFTPLFVVIYKNRFDLLKHLKSLDRILVQFPLYEISLYLVSLDRIIIGDKNFNSLDLIENNNQNQVIPKQKLVLDQIIIRLLLGLELGSKYYNFPLLPFIHPAWFIKNTFQQFLDSGKILLTPFILDYTLSTFNHDIMTLNSVVRGNLNTESESLFLDIKERDFEEYRKAYITDFKIQSGTYMKFQLNLRHDDLFDILDSI